jgi:hypothetical protein
MKKVIVIAACGLACVASSAFAQVGLGGGVVGTLGANGAASSIGGLGSGISTGAQMRGTDVRTGSQTGTIVQTPAASGSTSNAIDTKANGSGIRADSAAGASASAGTPVLSGSAWGSAQPSAGVSTPDLDGTKDTAKNTAKNSVDGLEDRRDRIEGRTDKKVDRTIDKL